MQPTAAQLMREVRIAKEARRFPEALSAIDKAIASEPNDAPLLVEKAVILRALGNANAARETAHRATVAAPTSAEAHAQLGLAFLDQSKFANAESSFKRALQYDSTNASALAGYGTLRLKQKRFADAEAFLIRAVRARPSDSALFVLLGDVFAARSNQAGMIEAYRRARDTDFLNTEALDKYLAAKQEVGGVQAARAALEEAVARMPGVPLVHYQLGRFLSSHGLLDDAAVSFRRALSIDPASVAPLQFLAESKKFASSDDEDFRLITHGYTQSPPGSVARAMIAFALAKAADDIKDYDRAFDAYLEGNTIMRRSSDFSMARELEAFRTIETAFSRDLLLRFKGAGHSSAKPIFIVGMPRSGTTLTETILSRHPDVYAAGELEAMRISAGGVVGLSPVFEAEQFVQRLKPAFVKEIGATYLSHLGDEPKRSLRVTDKLPHNFRLVGLIRMVFPNASIVHVRRDPLDNCLSMFKANFGAAALGFSYDLVELGHYHNLYRRLMHHWRAVMPGEFFEIDYEALVSDPETATRALFAYCGLDWSPQVLAIESNTREVQTVSFAQVRRPIHTGSISAATRYGHRLDPLRAALAEYDG